ncbi:MAG: outer membrane lipoprotein carrier protein LolA [Crocinitomicaceae bacterium]
MKKITHLIIAVLFAITGIAQDEKAKEILDKASAKLDGYKTLTIKFSMTIIPPEGEGEPISQKGKIYVKGEKYMLDVTDQEVYSDGENIVTYFKEDNECYRSTVEEAEEDVLAPTELLTLWEKGYNYKYGETQEYAGSTCDVVFLYPKNPKDSKFHTVKMLLSQETNEVVYVYLKGKDGTNMQYKLVSMELDLEIPDSKFVFNEAEHPGVECFDE